jgi:hypothetical protein
MTQSWQGPAIVFAIVFVILAVAFGPTFYQEYKTNRILKHGTKADARVLSIHETGNLYNNQPEVRIDLQIMPASLEPFEASITTFMSPAYLSRFQPGATVAVRYESTSHRDVALVPP